MKKIICILLTALFLVALVNAQRSVPGVCCEKTKTGAWCINDIEENCNSNYQTASTSCESTSYCASGTCYDSVNGFCMENTPKRVCDENKGTWDSRDSSEIPQCQLGCCIIVDQAAFVPLVRCKRLSTLFGVSIDYRTNINSEIECIATANSQDEGACVFEHEFERNCRFTTRQDCGAEQKVLVAGEEVDVSATTFYKGLLCSSEELNTICARQASTGCYKGQVYWLDSCGNRENIYSSDREKSWNNGQVAEPDDICSPEDGDNPNCGNCDYLLGTRCGEAGGLFGRPNFGDYICKKTTCKDEDTEYKNGEAWCVYDIPDNKWETGVDPVGSRQFKKICIDGEIHVEPCADLRNEICIEDEIELDDGEYRVAACRANRWQDCVGQTKQSDCENSDKRDCRWVAAITGMAASGGCVPKTPPGFDFWSENTDGTDICSQANLACTIVYEKTILGGKDCVKNCECKEENWLNQINSICTSLGDCGGYINYLGKYSGDGFEWLKDGKEIGVSKEFEDILRASVGVGVVRGMR